MGCPAAVDDDRLADDVGCGVAREPEDGASEVAGRPSTGSGVLGFSQAAERSSSYRPLVISLRKNPGASVFTQMPRRAHCTASSFVRPDRPCLLAA
jgi:hypothetical protein